MPWVYLDQPTLRRVLNLVRRFMLPTRGSGIDGAIEADDQGDWPINTSLAE
jgi:hypothetical protein